MGRASSRKRTQRELSEQLRRQHGFLERFGQSFDAGHLDEAWSLATTVRVLVHDTAKSISLLEQLAVKDTMRFLDTGDPVEDQWFRTPKGLMQRINVLGTGLLLLSGHGTVAEWKPRLDEDPETRRWIPFKDWWEQAVLRSWADPERLWRRRKLVLSLANQEGGAHVDPDVDEHFDAVLRKHAGRFTIEGPGGPAKVTSSPVPPTVRQIAYELQLSLERQFPDLTSQQ